MSPDLTEVVSSHAREVIEQRSHIARAEVLPTTSTLSNFPETRSIFYRF